MEVFASGNAHHVALLHGNTSRDHFVPPTDLKRAIEQEYGPLAQRGQELYVGGVDPLYGAPTEQWATDGMFRCPAVAQLGWHAAAGHPAFEYEFARVPPGRGAPTTHGGDIRYVFGTLDRSWVPGVPPPSGTAVDQQISDVRTNFAKTGDPNGGQLPVWPTFDVSSRAYIQFTDAGSQGGPAASILRSVHRECEEAHGSVDRTFDSSARCQRRNLRTGNALSRTEL